MVRLVPADHFDRELYNILQIKLSIISDAALKNLPLCCGFTVLNHRIYFPLHYAPQSIL